MWSVRDGCDLVRGVCVVVLAVRFAVDREDGLFDLVAPVELRRWA